MKPVIFLLALILPVAAAAETAVRGPVIENFGPTFAVADRDVDPPEGFVYKAVFDVVQSGKETDQLSRRLESVARFLNMHARNGVDPERMQLAVVLHGKAARDALSNAAYQRRHETGNPNLDLMMALHKAGVRFYLCGQSAGFLGIDKAELAEPVELALSAMTMLVELQSQGYQLLP